MDLGNLAELASKRTCKDCGQIFLSDADSSALEKFADHTTTHWPTPAQWNQAHSIIQADRDRAKHKDKPHDPHL